MKSTGRVLRHSANILHLKNGGSRRCFSFSATLFDRSPIPIADDVLSMRSYRKHAVASDRRVGLVPTMGALHDGHLRLVEQAAMECDDVSVSVYVNPTQFAQNEDLSTYPTDFDKDYGALMDLNEAFEKDTGRYKGRVTMIFRPSSEVMYPYTPSSESKLLLDPELTKKLEGSSRPHFFGGVTTVVSKLFNIIQADRVYFGQKDIQQIVVVQRMIREFHFPTTLRCVQTIREKDGLAMSSRNLYLGQRRRTAAVALNKTLRAARDVCMSQKNASRAEVLGAAKKELQRLEAEQAALPPHKRVQFQLDYISLADPAYLRELETVREDQGAVLSGALFMLPLEDAQPEELLGIGNDAKLVRLIDNLLVGAASEHLGVIEAPSSDN